MDINDAIAFVIDEVEQPALDHPDLEEVFKGKVRSSRTVARQMKKIGDLYHYLKRFENVVPEGSPGRDLYDRFQTLGLKTYEELFPEFIEKFKYYNEDVTTIDDFVVGQEYTSWDIAIFARQYNTMPGIYTIGEESNYQAVFVKATFEQGKYPNKWLDPKEQLLQYYMHSRNGVFKKSYKVNRAILHANQTNTPIYVFQKERGKTFTFKGIFQYNKDDYDPTDESRWFILEKQNAIEIGQAMTDQEYEQEVTKQVDKAKKDTAKNRKARLQKAKKKPGKVMVQSTQFDRNADVIAEVLKRSGGVCERCQQPAPFLRKNFTPYLEVHHQIPLAQGGEDTVENAIAVCPNCHQQEHFAAEVISVVAGIIIENNQIMIAQRSENDKLAGKWEFPGGKVKNNETFEQGLRRELQEELNIITNIQVFLGEEIYNREYRIMAYIVERTSGEYELNDHQDIRFVNIEALSTYDFLPADIALIQKLQEHFQEK